MGLSSNVVQTGRCAVFRVKISIDFPQSLNKSFPNYTAADNIFDAHEAGLGVLISV